MRNIITHKIYQKGDIKAVDIWRMEIIEVLQSLNFKTNQSNEITTFEDMDGNQFEIFIGHKAQAEILLWQEYDEREFMNGDYLVCAMEVTLKRFGTKIYCKINPFRLGYAIDFLYSSKESFKEMVLMYINIAIQSRAEMNRKLLESDM